MLNDSRVGPDLKIGFSRTTEWCILILGRFKDNRRLNLGPISFKENSAQIYAFLVWMT